MGRPCNFNPRSHRRALLAGLVTLGAFAYSRAETSPLSIHPEGFGLQQSPHAARERAMGDAGMASITRQGISLANSSRTAFQEKTSFTATADGDIDYLQDERTSNRTATFLIPSIGLNFSLRKYGHLGLFYRQRFHRNFSYTPLSPSSEDGIQTFSAEGGVYEAGFSYAYSPVPSLALGIGYHYYMGRERLIESARYSGDLSDPELQAAENMDDTLSTRSQGGLPSLSVTFRQPRYSLALAGALGTTLDQTINRSVTQLVSNQKWTDTKDLPWSIALGGAFKPAPNQTLVADFALDSWEEVGSGLLNPAFKAGMGYEFQGRGGMYEPYLSKVAYRGGLGFERLYLEATNLYFLTAGAGLPLGRRGSVLDFAIKYGHRGSLKNNLWSEDFVKLSVSLTGVGMWGQSVRKRR